MTDVSLETVGSTDRKQKDLCMDSRMINEKEESHRDIWNLLFREYKLIKKNVGRSNFAFATQRKISLHRPPIQMMKTEKSFFIL